MVKYRTVLFLLVFNIPRLKCIGSFHCLFKNTLKLLLAYLIFLKNIHQPYISFYFNFFFWKNKLEGILKAGLVRVPVKVKLLIKKERRANYVKTKNIEHIRSLNAETKKNDYFIPFRKQNFKSQSNNFTNHVFRSNRSNSTPRKLDSPCHGTWSYDFCQIKFWCETHRTVNTKNI